MAPRITQDYTLSNSLIFKILASYVSNKMLKDVKVAMTLLVRNEEDIIEDNILYHSSIGVDKFFIMDNLSTDMTRNILERLSDSINIQYYFQENDEYRQSEWVSCLARKVATDQAGFDWVINNDADEFWVFGNKSIKEFLSRVPESAAGLNVQRYNAINIHRHGDNSQRYSTHPSISEYFHVNSMNCLGKRLPPKCMHRAHPNVTVPQGNHTVLNIEGDIIGIDDAFILHYPYRTLDQYKDKIRLGGGAYRRNQDLDESVGITWRKHYQIVESDEMIQFWQSLNKTFSQVRKGLDSKQYMHCTMVSWKLKEIYKKSRLANTQSAVTDLLRNSERYCRDKRTSILTPLRHQVDKETLAHHNLAFSLGGSNAQVHALRRLDRQVSEGLGLAESLNEIRDCFSLLPDNPYFIPFLRRLYEIFSPNAVHYLRNMCLDKVVLLHVSCAKYLSKSMRSSGTFHALGSDYVRLIVVGNDTCHAPDTSRIEFQSDRSIFKIPVSDDYEYLGTKVFHALMILRLIGEPSYVVKLDDDLELGDSIAFHNFIQETKASGHSYVGWKVGSSHANQWHGWHIGKCHDKSLEKKGFQYPVVTSYAAGGFGYVLDRSLLSSCAYMYLAMRSFFGQHIIQLEDVYVGHAAQMANKSVHPIIINRPIAIHKAALPGITRNSSQ